MICHNGKMFDIELLAEMLSEFVDELHIMIGYKRLWNTMISDKSLTNNNSRLPDITAFVLYRLKMRSFDVCINHN